MASFNTPSNSSFAPVYPAYGIHRNSGQRSGSALKAVLISLGALVVLGVIGVGILIVIGASLNKLGKHVVVGTKDQVYFRDGITEQEATAVGQSLKSIGYLKDRGVTVTLSKDGDSKVLAFVVEDGAWDQAKYVSAFEVIGRAVAPTLGGLPLKVRLLNDKAEIKKEIKLT